MDRFSILASKEIQVGISNKEETKEWEREKEKAEIRRVREEGLLRKVTVKIELEKINTQEGVTVEVLLDSRATDLVMSSEFIRK